jgi:hypothetical protein
MPVLLLQSKTERESLKVLLQFINQLPLTVAASCDAWLLLQLLLLLLILVVLRFKSRPN